jgi:peptide deformylase
MATLKIVTDQEFLRKKSKQVTEFNARLHQLLDDMRDTLKNAKGSGLAAVQVGVLYRACLVSEDAALSTVTELINPEIIAASLPKKGDEGCLSIPNTYAAVIRPQKVTVRAQDRNGITFKQTFEKTAAVCVSHEIDHLNGILFTDRVR